MPDPVIEQVLDLLGSNDHLADLTQLLVGLDEKQRKALSGPVRKAAERTGPGRAGQAAAAVAVLGCVTGVRQVASALEWLSLDGAAGAEAAMVEVTEARRPHWLPDLPEALLAGRERTPYSFRVVRALVRAGVLPPPTLPEYPRTMVRGLVGWGGWQGGPSVLDRFREDLGLLDHELWQMLATEGAGKDLGFYDSWKLKAQSFPPNGQSIPARPEHTWRHALATLAEEGLVDRDRLLDAALAAFLRDWSAADVTWFVALHDELAPSVDEVVARQATYGRLLAVEPGPPVQLGLRALGALLDADRLDPDVLLTGAPALLTRRDKGTAMAGLKLLEQTAIALPTTVDGVAAAVAHALAHDRLDVQERAQALLDRLVPDEGSRQPAAPAPAVAPEPLADPTPPPVAAPLEPVADADELAELLARLVEEADDPAEVERLLEGTMRLARRRPSRGVDALAARLHELTGAYYPGPWSREELRADLVQLGLTWLDGGQPGAGPTGRLHTVRWERVDGSLHTIHEHRHDRSLAGIVTRRIHEVAVAVAAGGGSLLSFPSRCDGSLDGDELVARVRSLGRASAVRPLDAGTALLRVRPEDHDQLRFPSAHRTGSFLASQLALLATHRPAWEPITGESHGQYEREVVRATTWRDAAPSAGGSTVVAIALDRHDPLLDLALEAADGEYGSRYDQVTATWPLLFPHHPDLLAAHAHPRLVRALTKNRNGTEPILEALGASSRPLGPPAHSALVLGLGARNGSERARAVDALVDIGDRASLDGRALGVVLAILLAEEAVTGSRIVPGLVDASRSSGRARWAILDALTEAMPAFVGRRDAHLFVDLAAQLAIQQGRRIALPEFFLALARGKQGSMLAKACRRVPVED